MQPRDDDIEELEHLLGGTRAEYTRLRHENDLRTISHAPKRLPYRRLALVATVLLTVTVAALGVLQTVSNPKPSQLAFSPPSTAPVSLFSSAKTPARLTAKRPRMAVRLRMPRRPLATSG
ncbi:MAG: hypothetical protein AAFP68_04625 [Pseudomonadota bacterium]